MKIKSVAIENFRSIKCATFDFKDLIVLLGKNNTGKTNILKALDWFFGSSVRGMSQEDFCNKDIHKDIRITVSFDCLTADEQTDDRIKKYLINGTLTIQKVFSCDPETGKFESKFSGLIIEPKEQFLKMSEFDSYKHDIEKIAREKKLPDYFKTGRGTISQESYKEGLKRYVEENRQKIEWDKPFFSSTHFLGWKEVAQDFMPHFFYVPAVKEASEEATYGERNLFGRLIDDLFIEAFGEEPKLSELKVMLEKVGSMLNRPSQGEDKRPRMLKEFEKSLLGTLQESMPSTVDVEIQVAVPEVRDIVQSGTQILLDDGIKTSVESKGHGLQRSLIFAIFREYANLSRKTGQKKKSKPFIFAIEEPELYLHPHHEVVLFHVLQALSKNDQIIFCTHSPYFIDMSRYDALIIVDKPDTAKGTETFQCKEEIFSPDEKDHFKMLNEFNPERNEVFFARKVMLVEGPSEKLGFPMLAKKTDVDLYSQGVSLIECGGKTNIPFFMKILNAFRIPHIVVHDVDPIKAGETDKDKVGFFKLNATIKNSLDAALGEIVALDPDFDTILGVSKHQIDKLGKPFAVFNRIKEMKPDEIAPQLKGIITKSAC